MLVWFFTAPQLLDWLVTLCLSSRIDNSAEAWYSNLPWTQIIYNAIHPSLKLTLLNTIQVYTTLAITSSYYWAFFYVPNTGAPPYVNIWGRFLLFLTILGSIWEQRCSNLTPVSRLLVLLDLIIAQILAQIVTTAIRFVVLNLLQSLYDNCWLGEQFWLEERALPRLNSGWGRL
jgi:hypothetical protein